MFPKEVNDFEKIILKRAINKKKRLSFKLKHESDRYRNQLKERCSQEDFQIYHNKIRHFCNIIGQKYDEKHRKKLGFWMKKADVPNVNKAADVDYINLTKVKFSAHEDSVLKLGPKFILNEPIDVKDAIANIETAIETIPEAAKHKIRNRAQEELEKFLKHPQKNYRDESDRKCLKRIKSNPNITCIMTDKTGKICIMERKQYVEMMEEAITKLQVEPLKFNPVTKLFEKTKDIIKNSHWDKENYPKISNHAPIIPRLFGRYKDHKNPPTLRPIVNRTEGPTYTLEKYMNKIYKSILPPSEHSLTSTAQFIKCLKEINITEDDMMVSFDVKDLFPSVDTNEIIPIINKKIKEHYTDKEIADTLIRTNNLLLRESFFQFNGKFYKQTKGVPMGSSISGTIAELKLRLMENSLEVKKKFKIWLRYVDDIFCIISSQQDPEKILQELNAKDPNIKFTLEKEHENCINFLDVKILRKQNSIETTVYRKPTNNNLIIHNKCNTPYPYKTAALRSYIDRAILVCSNNHHLFQEINYIKSIAQRAGYNKKIVQNLFKKRMNFFNHIPSAQKEKKIFTSSIPFLQGISLKIQREAAKLGVFIPIKPNPNLFQKIRNEKDKINPIETAGIYQITFETEDEQQNQYIGVTKRRIQDRYKEHLADLRLARNTTALSRVNLRNNIKLNTLKLKKIANFTNHHQALHRESIEIFLRNCCNEQESINLNTGWRKILSSRTTQLKQNQERQERKSEESEVTEETQLC